MMRVLIARVQLDVRAFREGIGHSAPHCSLVRGYRLKRR